jgi:hypothetical protein
MTYLEVVNRVLALMREPTTASLVPGSDVVVDIVAQQVNDAKRSVEDAHNWNALYQEWTVTIPAGEDKVAVVGSGKLPLISDVYGENKTEVKQSSSRALRALQRSDSGAGAPRHYAVAGQSTAGDAILSVYPTPSSDYAIDIAGYRKQDDLSEPTDRLLVPELPVIYLALALAARERGEVGGQTSLEIFGMADKYLSDAIANDASLNSEDYIWYS